MRKDTLINIPDEEILETVKTLGRVREDIAQFDAARRIHPVSHPDGPCVMSLCAAVQFVEEFLKNAMEEDLDEYPLPS